MSTAKHTPGQWRVDAGRHGYHIRSGKPSDPLGGNLVAQVFSKADVHVIEAAPDLLEACNLAVEKLSAMGLLGSVECRRISAAIAKATGSAS